MAAMNRLLTCVRSSRSNICYLTVNGGMNRMISTSGKNKDTPTLADTWVKKLKVSEKVETKAVENNNWITYGFSFKSEADDRYMSHIVFFGAFTILLVGGAFILAYQPDLRMADWTRREAFLELHRREKLGLPLVDRNLIDPSRIVLPTDEELGDTEIII